MLTMKSVLPSKEGKWKKSNSRVMTAQRISQSFQEDKKYRCKLTKSSSVGRCWNPHHWKCLSLRKKKKWKVGCLGFVSFPGGGPSLFSPILSKDLTGPLSTSSKNFFQIVSKNVWLIESKIGSRPNINQKKKRTCLSVTILVYWQTLSDFSLLNHFSARLGAASTTAPITITLASI